MPLKITWQVVATVDPPTKTWQLMLVGRRTPDLPRYLRKQVIHASRQQQLPACWNN